MKNYKNEILNRVLYEMCEEFPDHKSPEAVRAKVVIIGRTYASGAERHVIPKNGDLSEPLARQGNQAHQHEVRGSCSIGGEY